jgi:tetratricopeptide (TPR) repeat protein
MNNRCSICHSPLDEFGKCRQCEGPQDKPLGRIWALIVTVSIIAALVAGTIYLNKYIGGPFEILKKLRRSRPYKITRAAKNLPVAGEPKESLTLDQYIGLREYFEDQQFDILNTLFEKYQEEFETDVYNEYKIFDVCRVFRTTLPGYEDIFESWLQFSPNHYAPYLARAHYFYEYGWESRGYRFRKDTPDEQIQKMRHFFRKAVEDVNRARAIDPKLIPAYTVLLGVYNATGDEEGEFQTIETALELFPESFLMRSTYMWAIEPRWGGSYEQMEEFAKEAEEYYDLNPELTVLYGFIYSDQAKRFKSNEKYEQALNMYTTALSYGDNFEFYHARAEIYHYYLNEAEKALADVERSITFRPLAYKSYQLRSRIYYKMGDIDSALDDLDTADLLKPAESSTDKWRNWAAQNLLKKGHNIFKEDLNQAIEDYSLSLMFNPDIHETYYWRGVAHYRLRHHEEALVDFEKSIELNPSHFDSYRMIDYTLLQNKEWDRIISYWNTFLELEPEHAEAYLERSGTYYHKKDFARSLKDLKQACDLGSEEGCKRYNQYRDKWQ